MAIQSGPTAHIAAHDWLTLTEASTLSRFSIITLRRALKARELRGYRLRGGRQWRIRREDLELWLRGVSAAA